MPDAHPPAAPATTRPGKLKKLLRWGVLLTVVLFIALQLVPVEGIGSNPEERYTPDAPPEVLAILRESCFDCHSNETKWPLYARIAPGSWLMARDVKKGRNAMNFSEWGDYDAEQRAYDKEESWEEIEKGEMPPWFYVYPFHLGAKLDDQKKAILKAWLLAPEPGAEGKDDDGDKPAEDAPAEAPPAE